MRSNCNRHSYFRFNPLDSYVQALNPFNSCQVLLEALDSHWPFC